MDRRRSDGAIAPVRRPRIEYLVTLRRRAGLTQQGLADLSGVSQPTISRLERTRRQPDLVDARTVRRLAAALGADPYRLQFGPDPAVRSAFRRHQRRRVTREAPAEAPATADDNDNDGEEA